MKNKPKSLSDKLDTKKLDRSDVQLIKDMLQTTHQISRDFQNVSAISDVEITNYTYNNEVLF